jgi:phosphate butyryltransferase
MTLHGLADLKTLARQRGKKRIAVAAAQDEDVLRALRLALAEGICDPVLIGDTPKIIEIARDVGLDLKQCTVLHETENQMACEIAVRAIANHEADILMKGLVNTSALLKAVLSKSFGITQDRLLSHVAFFDSPYYHKTLCVTDAAINISPDPSEKLMILQNAIDTCHKLGIVKPLVAMLAPVEVVNSKIESTIHGASIAQMQKENLILDCIVEGPMALDVAISSGAAEHKNLISDVAGNADILVAHDLNSGNLLYKSLVFLGGATASAVVAGASVPIVLTSRADSDKSKFLSIALAVALS